MKSCTKYNILLIISPIIPKCCMKCSNPLSSEQLSRTIVAFRATMFPKSLISLSRCCNSYNNMLNQLDRHQKAVPPATGPLELLFYIIMLNLKLLHSLLQLHSLFIQM